MLVVATAPWAIVVAEWAEIVGMVAAQKGLRVEGGKVG
jgi:hypothetical protein